MLLSETPQPVFWGVPNSGLRGFPGILASGRGLQEAVKVRTPLPVQQDPRMLIPGFQL